MEFIRLIMAISFLGVFLSSSNMIKINVACNPRDREAVINFKHNLKDPSEKLRSWVGNDCCKWKGVICKNKTEGDVVQLKLSRFWLSGKLDSSSLLELKYLYYLDLSWNKFFGIPIPTFLGSLQNLRYLDLHGNSFTGKVPPHLGNLSSLYYLDLSLNKLERKIPRTLGNLCNLEVLDLSFNNLQGEISSRLFGNTSRCSANKLKSLNLEYNLLSGRLPDEFGTLKNLEELSLRVNSFSGSIPMSIGRLSLLRILDLGENRFTGVIPTWIGERLKDKLVVLRLRSNKFRGEIPRKLCHLIRLQILDLGHNNLSGSIPKCFGNFSTMASNRYPNSGVYFNYTRLSDKNIVDFVAKGKEIAYVKSLIELVAAIDLSNNKLYGEIPEELTYLFGLQTLNLANNSFTGRIPKRIGHLNSLELLDLSNNRLSGSIPRSLTNLTFISYLNLSYNNLSGRIPSRTLLQSFSELSYTGNHDLCGFSLKKCGQNKQLQEEPNGDSEGSMEDDEDEDEVEDDEDEGWNEIQCFYMGLPFGFVVGFWCLWGVLLVKRSWGYAYFRFLDDIAYKLSTRLSRRRTSSLSLMSLSLM